jgi:hypothetical protein
MDMIRTAWYYSTPSVRAPFFNIDVSKKEGRMAGPAGIEEEVDALELGFRGFEEVAHSIFDEAQRAAALIPSSEFEEVFETAPVMSFHHRFVQSILTWVWYEVHENEVPLENLPLPLGTFFQKYERSFASYWM